MKNSLYYVLFCLLFSITLLSFGGSVHAQSSEKTDPELSDIFEQADAIPSLRSLLIQQNGKLIDERYFDDRDPNRAFNIKSASKSIISLLSGIAIDEGYIASVDKTLGDYFPEYFEENPNSKKENITIKNMLSMQTGLETTSFYNYGAWVISDDWIKFQLDQPFTEEPGGTMVYSTGTSHLLSVIITKATEMTTREFAAKHLFGPMNISIGGWDKDPDGYYMGGNNLALKPSDMLKIGQMVLNGGTYDGTQIISSKWLQESFQSYTRSNFNPYNYGYMWWNKPAKGYQIYFAWGFGGQYIFMIPDLNAVIVMTSSLANATQQRSYKEPVFNLLENQVIPFLEKTPAANY